MPRTQMKKMSAAQRKAAAQHNPWEKLFGPNVHLEDSSSCLLKPEAALKVILSNLFFFVGNELDTRNKYVYVSSVNN